MTRSCTSTSRRYGRPALRLLATVHGMRTRKVDSPNGRIWGFSLGRSRAGRIAGLGLAAVALFLGYLRMSRSEPMNADGASTALQ